MRTPIAGELMKPHSMAIKAAETAISSRKGQPPHQTAAITSGISTSADTARRPRFFQSNRLAGREDVIDVCSAIATFPRLELFHRRLQVLGAIVGPEHVLEDELGIGGFPQQEVGDAPLA